MTLARNATFRQLASLDAVARLGSVSLAAAEMHLTPSAVSIQIGGLETSAGTPLVQRSGRGIRLTEAGELLSAYASRMLGLWQEAGDEMAALQGVFSGTLRVGAVTTAEYLLPPLLVTFANASPMVKVKLQVGNRDAIVRMLAAQEIDLAIMGRPPGELKTESLPFARHPMAFVAAPSHRLMADARPGIERLAEAPILVRERGSGTRATVERLFKDAGVPMRIGSELSSNEAIKQMCAAGFGVAFLSLHTCVLEMNAGLLELLPIRNNPIDRDWHVMHLASRQLSQVASAFKAFLRDHGQSEVDARMPSIRPGVSSRPGSKRSRPKALRRPS